MFVQTTEWLPVVFATGGYTPKQLLAEILILSVREYQPGVAYTVCPKNHVPVMTKKFVILKN